MSGRPVLLESFRQAARTVNAGICSKSNELTFRKCSKSSLEHMFACHHTEKLRNRSFRGQNKFVQLVGWRFYWLSALFHNNVLKYSKLNKFLYFFIISCSSTIPKPTTGPRGRLVGLQLVQVSPLNSHYSRRYSDSQFIGFRANSRISSGRCLSERFQYDRSSTHILELMLQQTSSRTRK